MVHNNFAEERGLLHAVATLSHIFLFLFLFWILVSLIDDHAVRVLCPLSISKFFS